MKTLFLLPGFLGRPADFAEFQKELENQNAPFESEVLDWLNFGDDFLATDLEHVGEKLFRPLQRRGPEIAVLGYSLGGRLGLSLREVMLRENVDWPFFFVSVNPGLNSSEERQSRREADARWAERFLNEDWSSLLAAWNAQGVFKDSRREPERSEADYRREDLARILKLWSLGEQKDYRPSLHRHPEKITWITGALDPKFTALSEGLPGHIVLPGASHRVPLDAPASLATAVIESLRWPRKFIY